MDRAVLVVGAGLRVPLGFLNFQQSGLRRPSLISSVGQELRRLRLGCEYMPQRGGTRLFGDTSVLQGTRMRRVTVAKGGRLDMPYSVRSGEWKQGGSEIEDHAAVRPKGGTLSCCSGAGLKMGVVVPTTVPGRQTP